MKKVNIFDMKLANVNKYEFMLILKFSLIKFRIFAVKNSEMIMIKGNGIKANKELDVLPLNIIKK